ncbi:MAG: hypothetical protein ABIP75_13490 [Pyrinomonadaceae bacterium]
MSCVVSLSSGQNVRQNNHPESQAAPRAKAPWQLTRSKEWSFEGASRVQEPAKAGTQSAGQDIRIVEATPDGGYVVEIAGVKYRAVTDEQLRTIAERKVRLEVAEKDLGLANFEIERLQAALTLAQKDAELAGLQSAVERERSGRFEAMFNGEHLLRLQAETLAPRGRMSRFFDNPIVQVAIKVGLPLAAAIVSGKR